MSDPFKPEVFILRVPIKRGEVEYKEITLRPPVLKDILKTDGHDPDGVAYARALLSSLSGVPEVLLDQLVPEDWADIRVALTRTNMRFMGIVNLLDKKDGSIIPGADADMSGDPTLAAALTPPPNSETTSAA